MGDSALDDAHVREDDDEDAELDRRRRAGRVCTLASDLAVPPRRVA